MDKMTVRKWKQGIAKPNRKIMQLLIVPQTSTLIVVLSLNTVDTIEKKVY